jgi:hypothetical protein
MSGLPPVLRPLPRALTPERIALGAVVAITLAATAPALRAFSELGRALGPGPAGSVVVTAIAAPLAVLVARRALRATSTLRARLGVLLGGAAAGSLTAILGYVAVTLLGCGERFSYSEELPMVLLGGFGLGAPLGGAFGIAFAPAVVAAARARLAPAHDALDRVAFAAGISVAAADALARLVAPVPRAPHLALEAAGLMLAAAAAARLLSRIRVLERVRVGAVPGLTVEPGTDREDEDALTPLLRSSDPPTGVLVATGVVAAYRGERGAVKLARAPLPDEPFEGPIQSLIAAALSELGAAALAIPVGLVGLVGVAFSVALVIFSMSAAMR